MDTNVVIKLAILIFTVIYVFSSADACPGPIDDIIVALIGFSLGREI